MICGVVFSDGVSELYSCCLWYATRSVMSVDHWSAASVALVKVSGQTGTDV